MIEYRGYTGVFEYDDEYEFFAGHVVNTRDGINFEGRSVGELKASMRRLWTTTLSSAKRRGGNPASHIPVGSWSVSTPTSTASWPPKRVVGECP